MYSALCQFPDQPCLYRTKQKIPGLCTLACPLYIVKNPLDLGGRKISINHQACLAADLILQTTRLEFVRILGCPAALPHDCMVHRLSGILIPYNYSLSLIRNTNARNIVCGCSNLGHCLYSNTKLR